MVGGGSLLFVCGQDVFVFSLMRHGENYFLNELDFVVGLGYNRIVAKIKGLGNRKGNRCLRK